MQTIEQNSSFIINMIGSHTNNSYMGTFKVKCLLSPLEEIQADKTYRSLLGDNSHLALAHVRQYAFALSQLQQRIIEAPPFWQNEYIGGGHILDQNIISEVLNKAIEAQEKYIEKKQKELATRQETLTQLIKDKELQRQPELETEQERDEV